VHFSCKRPWSALQLINKNGELKMNPDDFEITKEKIPNGVKFIIHGRINTINADQIQIMLNEAMKEKPGSIVFNMFHVVYMSSAGLKVILKTYKDAKETGITLGIEMPSENVLNILKMTALDGLLVI